MARRITRDINRVTFTARMGADPEMVDAGGHDLCKIRVAVSRWNKKNKENDTDWYGVNVWGEEAKHAMQMLKKGQPVVIHGRLAIEKWTAKDGAEKLSPTITADSIFVLSGDNFVKVTDDDAPSAAMPKDELPF